MRTEKVRKPLPTLDAKSLETLALRYVERFATSRSKLARYLVRKLRERGWTASAPPPVESIVQRLADLGYVDDRGFGEARARGLERRGYGARRVGQDLRASGIAEDLRGAIVAALDTRGAALTYARRRRFGPFGPQPLARETRTKQFGAMLRAGHDARITAEILGTIDETTLYDA